MMRVFPCVAVTVLSFALGSTAQAQTGQNRTTPVTIIGTATVKDADNPGRHPFHAKLCAKLGDITCSFAPNSLDVASGVRAVIEFVSALCLVQGSAPTLLGIGVGTTLEGVSVQHYLSSANSIAIGSSTARGTVSQSMRLYADPGTSIQPIVVAHSETPGISGFCQIAISGHTITP